MVSCDLEQRIFIGYLGCVFMVICSAYLTIEWQYTNLVSEVVGRNNYHDKGWRNT